MPTKQKSDAKKNTTAEKTSGEMLDSVFDRMSAEYAIPKEQLPDILRKTAFKQKDGDAVASQSEMIALLSVAEKYKMNPFTREIHAFRTKTGVIMPIVGVDGWIKIMNNHPQHDGFKLRYPESNKVTIGKSKPCFEWMEIEIYRKDRKHPVIIPEYLDECYNGGKFSNDPWDTHTKRFLRHKTISQGVRVAYGVNEIYDIDEAHRIDAALAAEANRETDLETPETAENISTEVETIEDAPGVEDKEKGIDENGMVNADTLIPAGTADPVALDVELDGISATIPAKIPIAEAEENQAELNIFQDTPAPTQEKTPEDKPVTTNEDEVPDLF